ncbi:hypothetical protein J7T55_007947 [Diaporthe amygdali]|uniref:uncharacterized protein n=1 Tax=Phomopsis amygdali TaxID=1214568 RepID=UPI0022FECBA0|nr:uncharacterized protein J7T55_007947 [Diaporthe amygdali]KAJ0114113.1 hypothetical protein J7T55_007947 [Diaporthe amygdali]
MSQNSQSEPFTPEGSEHGQNDASATSNVNDGPSDSPKEEDLQNARILAHARSVATPPATPMTDVIEMDITSVDVREHSPRVYLARHEIRPPSLTEQEIADVIRRLEVDLTSALGKIRAKSHRKPWAESMLMIEMRMSGILKPGSTKVRLRPCIWLVCGSKWCRKIVENDVKHLVWLSPYDVHFVHKGGPLLSADEEELPTENFAHPTLEACTTPIGGSRNFVSNHSIDDECTRNVEGQAGLTKRSYDGTNYVESWAMANGYHYNVESITGENVPQYSSSCTTATSGPWSSSSSSAPSSSAPSSSARSRSKPSISKLSRYAPWSSTLSNSKWELPCEFRSLSGCRGIFHVDEEQAWMDHIEEHLQSKFPSKLRCWFCSEHQFDAQETSGGDVRSNFMIRMRHIRDHFIHDGFMGENIQMDGYLLNHLRDQRLIDKRTYEKITKLQMIPAIPSSLDHREGIITVSSSRNRRRSHPESHLTHNTRQNGLASKTGHLEERMKPSPGESDPLLIINATQKLTRKKSERTDHDSSQLNRVHDRKSGIRLSEDTELYLHVRSRRTTSLIGLSCVSSIWSGRIEASRSSSKMGGAIAITREKETKLYGVTSGHGLIRQVIERAPQNLDGYGPLVSWLSDSSDSESEDEEESANVHAKAEDILDAGVQSVVALDLSDVTIWTSINHDLSAGFVGINFPPASQKQVHQVESHVHDVLSGDLALFPILSTHRQSLSNYYIEQDTMMAKDVVSTNEEEIEYMLPVVVLLGPEQAVNGTLLPGKFHFSMRGAAIETSRVRLERDLAKGSSGSWVVHDQKLYGMIIAVFPGDCLALMIPAKKMLCDIQAMFPDATGISVDTRI